MHTCVENTFNRKDFESESEGRGEILGAKRHDGMSSTTQRDVFVCVERNRNRSGKVQKSLSLTLISTNRLNTEQPLS